MQCRSISRRRRKSIGDGIAKLRFEMKENPLIWCVVCVLHQHTHTQRIRIATIQSMANEHLIFQLFFCSMVALFLLRWFDFFLFAIIRSQSVVRFLFLHFYFECVTFGILFCAFLFSTNVCVRQHEWFSFIRIYSSAQYCCALMPFHFHHNENEKRKTTNSSQWLRLWHLYFLLLFLATGKKILRPFTCTIAYGPMLVSADLHCRCNTSRHLEKFPWPAQRQIQ